MHICYIANASSIHTQRWINYFAEKGHEVHLISPMAGEGYAKGVQLHPLVRLVPKIWPVTRYFSGLLWLVQIRRLVSRIKPDILDAQNITVYGYLGACSGFHPLVFYAWGSDILIDVKQNPLWRALTKHFLKKAELITCTSPFLKETMIGLGIAPAKIEVAILGVDTKEFSPELRDEALMKELGIFDSPRVISIRNLEPIYSVETLIKAIPLVLTKIPQAKFVIAGGGKQSDYLKILAQSLGVSDNVRFVGMIPRKELPRYLASSDVYVSTSLSDGTSQGLLEAMACGLAPVVTDLPGNRDWVNDGENGYIVPVRDHQTLADRTIYLLEASQVRRRFGKANRKIIKERAEYDKGMARVERMYKELVRKSLKK